MGKVLITRSIPVAGINMLTSAGHEVFVANADKPLLKKKLIEMLEGGSFHAVVTLLDDKIDGDVLNAAKNVKIFANYAVGYNNIDVKSAEGKGICITNTPDVLTTSVAEYAVSMILALSKRISESDRFTRSGKFKGWEPDLLLGSQLEGKSIGILGAGRIGTRVAEMLVKAFKMRCIYHDRNENKDLNFIGGMLYASPEELLEEADVLSVHLPLLDSTHHFLDKRRMSKMKRSSIIVNTARGAIIKEDDLVDMLRGGWFAGVGLDVFENEPKFSKKLKSFERVLLTPHIASATVTARNNMSILVAENIIEILAGRAPKTPVYR